MIFCIDLFVLKILHLYQLLRNPISCIAENYFLISSRIFRKEKSNLIFSLNYDGNSNSKSSKNIF